MLYVRKDIGCSKRAVACDRHCATGSGTFRVTLCPVGCSCMQVGLTNMNVQAVSSIVDAGVPVANNQVRSSPLAHEHGRMCCA